MEPKGQDQKPKDKDKDKKLLEFSETAGKVKVADVSGVILVVDDQGRWWLRHEVTTKVSYHSWKWVLSARNAFGQELFCIPRTTSEKRRMGPGRAEFWGVDKNIIACFGAITSWTIAGFGEFQFDEE